MHNRIRASISWSVLAFVLTTSAPARADSSQTCFDVVLAGGKAQVCATVHENRSAPLGVTVLALHGLTETAATFEPLTQALFADRMLKRVIRRVVALDLPGHGHSPAPTDLPDAVFGQFTLHDNVSVLIQAIDALRSKGMGPRVVMGHSMGGHAIAGAQEALLQSGSSLAARGVQRAILLAPVPVLSSVWTQPPPSDLAPFVVSDDAALGPYLALPPFVARIAGGFTTTRGELVPSTPSAEAMAPYVGWEPLTTALQLVGQVPGLPRLDARQGAFALWRGTLLMVVGFSEDVLTPAADHDNLYEHLIGRPGLMYRRIESATAVHNMFITEPEAVVAAFKRGLWTW